MRSAIGFLFTLVKCIVMLIIGTVLFFVKIALSIK